jgi:hypothetical protein
VQLDWWLDRINLLIDMMRDVDLGGAIALDYSAASLSALEAAARDRLADPAEADAITANFQIQLHDDAGFTGPYHLLYLVIERGDPSHTRAYYDEWVG